MEILSVPGRMRAAELLEKNTQESVMKDIPAFFSIKKGDFTGGKRINPSKNNISVLVFNMERGVNLSEIKEYLENCKEIKDFDIILANELDFDCERSGNLDISAEIAKSFHMAYAYGLEFIELVPINQKAGYHGNAVFSRFPIEKAEAIRLPEKYNWFFDRQKRIGGRVAVSCLLNVNGKEIACISAHLENRTDGEGRFHQFKKILNYIDENFPHIPVIIGGDMNTNGFDGNDIEIVKRLAYDIKYREKILSRYREEETLILEAIKRDYNVYPSDDIGYTRRKAIPGGGYIPLTLDFIFTRGIEAENVKIVSTEISSMDFRKPGMKLWEFDKSELSDHNAVYADLKFNKI